MTQTIDVLPLLVITWASYRLAHVIAGADSLLEGWQLRVKAWAWHVDDCGEPRVDECGTAQVRAVAGSYKGWRWPVAMARAKVATLLGCPFCAGYWIALAMLCTWAALWPWELGWRGWIISLAVAGAQSFLTAIDGRE